MSKETSPTAANGNGDSGGRNMEKTKVLYVQNLPDEFREDLSNLCTNFGPVKEMMPLPEKRSCFVEFETLEHAVACHDFYTKETVVLGARPIKFSYSSRQEITLKPNADNNPPGNILLITVNNVQYPVTVDVLYQVFCRVGTLEKVIIFERGSYIQAFVQLEDVRQAIKAKEQFDGQCVYNGCNTLRIQYSGLQSISVKGNSERSWDFTIGGNTAGHGGSFHNNQSQGGFNQSRGGNFAGAAGGGAGNGHCVCIVHNIHEEKTLPAHLAALFAVYANVQRVKVMFHKRSTALVQLERPEMCRNAINGLQNVVLHGQELKVEQSKGAGVPPAKPGEDFTKEFMTLPEYNRYRNQPLKSFQRTFNHTSFTTST